MSAPVISIIDYGMGNLFSVEQAFVHCGYDVKFAETPNDIYNAQALVLPGVGAFGLGMSALEERGLDVAIREVCSTGKPMLGICLGMQMMFEVGEEFGTHRGLGLIPGKVTAIPEKNNQGLRRKVPHIGWGKITGNSDLVAEGAYVYFVHSYMAVATNPAHIIAQCDYEGLELCAMVKLKNLVGCQFHPERSGEAGLSILRNLAKCHFI